MIEDLELERGEVWPGVDAQLVVEMAPNLVVRGQCVGLPTAAIQRDDQELPQPFAQRITLNSRP